MREGVFRVTVPDTATFTALSDALDDKEEVDEDMPSGSGITSISDNTVLEKGDV